jgi:hypothetical protein
MKLGIRGVSVFFASGDNGVAGPPGFDNQNGCLGSNSTIFNPGFPNKSVNRIPCVIVNALTEAIAAPMSQTSEQQRFPSAKQSMTPRSPSLTALAIHSQMHSHLEEALVIFIRHLITKLKR